MLKHNELSLQSSGPYTRKRYARIKEERVRSGITNMPLDTLKLVSLHVSGQVLLQKRGPGKKGRRGQTTQKPENRPGKGRPGKTGEET